MSRAGEHLSVYNMVSMLRNDFISLYPAYKPDDVLMLNFDWVCEELTMAKERELISINTQALYENSIKK